MSDLAGNFYSKMILTGGSNVDVISELKSSGSLTFSTAVKKFKLKSQQALTFSINGGPLCDFFIPTVSASSTDIPVGELTLESRDVYVNSFVVTEDGIEFYVEIIY